MQHHRYSCTHVLCEGQGLRPCSSARRYPLLHTDHTLPNMCMMCMQGSCFHRIVKGFVCQGGDVTRGAILATMVCVLL
jgi:hypothetical protein